MRLLIKGGHIVDPLNKLDAITDILVEDGKINKLGKNIDARAEKIIDAAGKIVIPGLVDMHVHLREPGREDKETIASATAAALKGGITSLLAMPNTYPAMDSSANIALLKKLIQKSAQAEVLLCGCITQGRQGKALAELNQLKQNGVIAISDDGASVDNAELMLQALKEAKEIGLLVTCHCEDKQLSSGGVVNLGFISTRLGLKGISRESEYQRVQRDIELAKRAQAAIHIAHLSCKESVEIVAQAKKKGIPVTCETAPHYFSLSDEAVAGFDTNMKVNPPLRSPDDVEAIKQGLKQGVIDAIASDHAPHTENEKDIEFDRAEFGTIGLETALAVGITELVGKGILSWAGLVEKMALNPAKILGINKGTLGVGACADLAIVSAEKEWLVEKNSFLSKSKNSAFLGRKLKGVVEYTIRSGKVYSFNKP